MDKNKIFIGIIILLFITVFVIFSTKKYKKNKKCHNKLQEVINKFKKYQSEYLTSQNKNDDDSDEESDDDSDNE